VLRVAWRDDRVWRGLDTSNTVSARVVAATSISVDGAQSAGMGRGSCTLVWRDRKNDARPGGQRRAQAGVAVRPCDGSLREEVGAGEQLNNERRRVAREVGAAVTCVDTWERGGGDGGR